jgi:hypothetical protein
MADPAPNPTIDRALVQMKLVDLPEVVVAKIAEPAEATEEAEAVEAVEASDAVEAAEQGGESE